MESCGAHVGTERVHSWLFLFFARYTPWMKNSTEVSFVRVPEEWKAQGRSSELQGGLFLYYCDIINIICKPERNQKMKNEKWRPSVVFVGIQRRVNVPMSSQKKKSARLENKEQKVPFCSVLSLGTAQLLAHTTLGCILVCDSNKSEGEIQERVCYFYAQTVFIDSILFPCLG